MADPNGIPLFRCKSCFALYQIVKAPAGPETADRNSACTACNVPLPAREGRFVLKYFLLRKASRVDVQRARQGSVRAKPSARPKKAPPPNTKEPGRAAGARRSAETRGTILRSGKMSPDQE